MTTLSPPPTPCPPVGRSARPATRQEQLSAAADRFGNLEAGDKRWESEQDLLDQLLVEAVQLATSPRKENTMTCPTKRKTARVTVLTAFLLAACADNGPGFSAEPSGDPAALTGEQRSKSDGGDHAPATSWRDRARATRPRSAADPARGVC